ncbi:MAG: alcohol dehydrogenase [Sphingomonas sp. SCN 67-18]|uniref:aldo/keto reductase n=1 Tax=uncultured Sphingomonas sp. TaxID=158754 RepID=UPI00086CF3AB|nr:aldo/keto reductase [Sphingomonas sp. SCN 67-18]ODU20013.1 MAG: alcohol dehydrogenase [Sphingomonas sp. SCN 67-18]
MMRALGKSGLSTPPLVLGGNVFGYTADRAASFAVLDAFMAGGGTMIDTADVYSAWVPGHKGGESETVIGEWLKRRGRRDDVLIATKVGMLPGEGGEGLAPARIAAAVEASLTRLGTDYIDLYYAHKDDPATPMDASLRALDALVKAGKVRALGASNFAHHRLDEALATAAHGDLTPYTVLQPEYNLVARKDFEGPVQQLAIDRGLGVLPYFGLASGFLTGKYRTAADLQGRERGESVKTYLNARGLSVIGAMDVIARESGATHAQIALAWIAAQPGVTAPIASATDVGQMEELLGAMRLTLSAEQIAVLNATG